MIRIGYLSTFTEIKIINAITSKTPPALSYKIDHVQIIWNVPFFLFDCENDEFLFDSVIQTDVESIAVTFTTQVCNIALLL